MKRRAGGTDPPKVVHITTVHPAGDARIFEKECRSLATSGYEVVLIATGRADGVADQVRVRVIPGTQRRLARMTVSVFRAFVAALQERASLYHFHDPELLPVGILLRAMRKEVIYDVHEDLPKQIMGKFYLRPRIRSWIARVADIIERAGARRLSAVVTATPVIARRFSGQATVIMNLPIFETFSVAATPYRERDRAFVYVGAMSIDRGLRTMVEAMPAVPDAKLVLAGHFQPAALEDILHGWQGHEQVEFVGRLDRAGVARLLTEARAGVVVLHPLQRYVEAYPVKLFEYMAAGIPLIAADYPGWREIVAGARCGLLIEPTSEALGAALQWILQHPDEAEVMGSRGAHAIRTRYGWQREAIKLVRLYDRLLSVDRS